MSTDAQWVSVSFGLPSGINEAVNTVVDILEVVSTILEIISAILDIIKAFIIDISSPLASLLEALLLIIEGLVEDFVQSGLYLYVDGPHSEGVSYFGANLLGGMPAWRSRMTYSLLSSKVPNRPQFSNSAAVFSLHLVVTSGNVGELFASFGFLLAMFNERANPNLNPPRNVSARAINENFYDDYYNESTGLVSDRKIVSLNEQLVSGDVSAEEMAIVGGPAIDLSSFELVLRYDLATGQELLIDKTSGAVLAVNNSPDAVLITWKVDANLIPNGYKIRRSETYGGTIQTEERTNTQGEVIGVEIVKDQYGQPVREWEDEFDVNSFDLNSILGRPHEQLAYLDTTVEQGLTYYYQVVPTFGDGIEVGGSVDGSDPISRVIRALLLAVQNAASGDGRPSEIVGVYVPNSDDEPYFFDLFDKAAEDGQTDGWISTSTRGDGGWLRVSLGGTVARMLLIAIEEIRNFVEALLASIQSGAEALIAFIELMQTKINTLNTFIEILQAIISLLQAFELLSFSCLFTTTGEGTAGVLSAVNDDSLEGVPDASDQDYVASMTILGGTANPAAFNAIRLLFGL